MPCGLRWLSPSRRALSLALLGPQAAADELVAHRARVKQQITKTKSDLNESTEALSKAAVAVDKAQHKLDAASAQLAATRQELTAAQVKDAQMEGRLRQARSDLAAAVAAVAAGQARLNAEQAKAGQLIRDQYQQQTNLLPVAVLVDPHSTEDWQTRLQWSTTLFDTTQAQIDRLTVLQRQLNAARVRQADLEAKVCRSSPRGGSEPQDQEGRWRPALQQRRPPLRSLCASGRQPRKLPRPTSPRTRPGIPS